MTNPHPLRQLDGHMNTYSGINLNILKPKADQIIIEDIARGLSNKGHFSGQTKHYFSIAEHCIMVAELFVDEQNKKTYNQEDLKFILACLLHDASEAYIGDMIKPMKILNGMKRFRDIEDRLQRVIFERFDLDYDNTMPIVKKFDKICQEIEYNEFYLNERNRKILYLTPSEAYISFMNYFKSIQSSLNQEE